MKNFCKIACLTIAAAASLVLKADYKFSAITNAATGATATTILVPDGSPVATSNMVVYVTQEAVKEAVETAVSTAKEYTDEAISEGGGGSGTPLKIASGSFVPSIAYAPLYDGRTNGSLQVSGCYLTNVVLNTTNGYPQSLTVHLNGTICGRVFDNEEVALTSASSTSGEATATIEDDSGKYYLSYFTSVPSDVLADAYRGYFYIYRTNPNAEMLMYSFAECRDFTNLINEVDATPMAAHNRSLITSKAVYDATSDKLKRTGGTMTGSLTFDTSSYASMFGWQYPKYYIGGPREFITGQTKDDGTTVAYNAGMSVGTRDIQNTKIKFPAGLWVLRSSNNPVRQDKWVYDEYGVAYEGLVLNGTTLTVTDKRLAFPTNSSGVMLDGTIARLEDLDFTNSLNTAIGAADSKATEAANGVQGLITSGLKNPYSLSLKSGGTQVNSYSGEYERSLNFGNGLSATANGATTTVTVDNTKFATVESVAAVKSDLEGSISAASEQAVDRLYAISDATADTVTAIYVISNTDDKTEYKVAVSTINGEWTSGGASFLQIDNPAPDGGNKRGWLKASMDPTQGVGIVYTNWTLYASIGASEPSSWSSYYAVNIYNKATPIFPMEIGEQKATYNGAYYIRKIGQFRGAASGYLSGDGSMYSIAGVKTNSLVTVSTMVSSIESAVSPVRSTANSASSGVSSLNTRMNSVEGTISSLKTVATSGKYSDLTGKPTKVSDFTNDEGYVKTSEITQEFLQDKGMATQQSLDDMKDSVEFIVPNDLSHVVDADLNIYSVSSTVDYVISAPLAGGNTETAWKRLRDSNGNTYTCKSSYNLNTSPSYVYFRYSRDGDSQNLVNLGDNPANSTYTNGIVIIKRAIYNQYQLCVYGPTANLVGHTADAFAKSVLDAVDGHVTIDGVNYYAKRNIFKGSDVLNRLATTNNIGEVRTEIVNALDYTTAVSNKVEDSFTYTTAVSNKVEDCFTYTTAVSNNVEDSFAYTTAVSNKFGRTVLSDGLCYTDGHLVMRHLFARAPYAFYWAANDSYYSYMKWRKIVFRNESDLSDYYIDFSPTNYGTPSLGAYKGVLRYYNKYSSSDPRPALMFQVRAHAGSVSDDEITFQMGNSDNSVRIKYFTNVQEMLSSTSFELTTQIGGGSGYTSYTLQALYDKNNPSDYGYADRAVTYSELYGGGSDMTAVSNANIPYSVGGVSFAYTSGTFGVTTTDWPNYKAVFIMGTVADGVTFGSNVKFNGFVNNSGTITPASESTIPRGTAWYGYIRRIGTNYYIEYIGTCE